ncbi:MAG: biotin/lipoate A/B protein ligase family protein [Phycisphaerae bacterium]|nr:lipoate--protein ligase family protein [Phycisphaerae bacterium]HOJ53715.1 biotin/lipoate A/B protein ligase family protein [Phycisphaerae bacterium]HOL27939.1 biotin/lipoate A/B protein ligase family protein [Phycisphaerae bacterium]HPP22225.1 biotin/lipoate A/B protein ligase family protein [Phycisphaerae bacterium]HQE42601.1 biotin/lipoate A/B protein ligase family protein [Phycisphaerae bacterium]
MNAAGMSRLRWLIDEPGDGPTNMARDEAILQCVGRGISPPTLRFYRWSPPTISLGYFQAYADYAALPPPAGHLAVVRRQTGGGAILHDLELTYALVLPLDHPWLNHRGTTVLYERVHSAFATILSDYGVPITRPDKTAPAGCSHGGPFFCFSAHSRFDLLVDGRKLMGSAQRRTATAVLQHGSLILQTRFDQQVCAAASEYADIDIISCLPRLAEAVGDGPVGEPGRLSEEELQLANELRAKYASPEWTRQR